MPRRRKTYKRRPKQSSWAQTASNVALTAGKALALATRVATLINVEHKYRDVLQSGVQPSFSSDNIFLVNGIEQGTDNTTRIGRSIKGMYLTYKAIAHHNPAATSNTITVKIVLDTKNQGGLPAVSDIFTIKSELGFRNIDHGSRFKVLDQKCFILTATNPTKCFEGYIELKNKEYAHTKYDGVGATNSDISDNPIYIILMSSDVTNLASISLNHRYRFVDN